MAIKTTWTEVNQIIKEEFQRVMEKKKIQNRIQQINEELAHMEEEDASLMEDENLEEVEAGGEMKVRSHAWTGEEDGDTKWTPEFDHKGSALLEEDELEVGDDDDDDSDEDVDLSDEFAKIGAAIEAKIMAALGHAEHEASETPEEEADEDDENKEDDEEFEEVEVDDEDDTDGDEGAMEEYREVVPMGDHGMTTTHDMDQDGKEDVKKESMNESVSRKNKKYLNVLSEGMDSRKQSALESEIERMRRLARLGNND